MNEPKTFVFMFAAHCTNHLRCRRSGENWLGSNLMELNYMQLAPRLWVGIQLRPDIFFEYFIHEQLLVPRFVLKLRLVISYIVFSRTSDAQLRTKVIKLLYPKQCLFEVYYASEARSYKEVSNLNFSTCELFFCHDMSIDQAEILVTS